MRKKIRTTPDDSETVVHASTCRCEACAELRTGECEKCGGDVHVEENNTTFARVCDDCGARGTVMKSGDGWSVDA